MEILWPILLIITSFAPIIHKLFKLGQPVIIDKTNMFGKFINLCCTTILNIILLYMCGFFVVFAWPQIVWIVMTSLGLLVCTSILSLVGINPAYAEFLQDLINKQKITYKIDFSDVLTIAAVLFIYSCGGAFHSL